MSITLKQSAGALVTPVDDALIYDVFMGNQVGIVEGIIATHLGANQLKISAGWGICQGRQFMVAEEVINAAVSTSGNMKGRLLIHIDVSADVPIKFETQAAIILPELIQEKINENGTIYQIEIATYDVTEITVSNLLIIENPVICTLKVANTALLVANAAMPRVGGNFTGDVSSPNWNRVESCLRNIYVNGASTNYILMVRK